MSFVEARKNIQAHFAANFTSLTQDEVAYDNVDFDNTCDSWVRFNVQMVKSKMVAICSSATKIRRKGMLYVQINVLNGKGTLESDTISEEVLEIFETVNLPTGECFLAGTKVYGGRVNDHHQVTVMIPFYFDQLRSI